ncbi:hypothetical protein EDB86DRAFT_3213919 [Lactarius hatsudake]|nr:hypothetical protein EDB86DRAFT_3213919 [Lactarius hatsudake]
MSLYTRSSDRCFPAQAKASGVNGNALEGGALDDHDASALWFRNGTSGTFTRSYLFSVRGLDVDAMYAGAARLDGEHDFCNLCKLDPAKQLKSIQRWVRGPLQRVRYTTAVLLLIGARLEVPSVVPTLLNSNPDERHVIAHALSLAVLPRGKMTPPAHVRKGLHRAVLAVVRACRVPALRSDCGRSYLAAAAPLHGPATRGADSMFDMSNEKERGQGGAVGRWDDSVMSVEAYAQGRNG